MLIKQSACRVEKEHTRQICLFTDIIQDQQANVRCIYCPCTVTRACEGVEV